MSLLEWLRLQSAIDCDTLDFEARSLGGFVDCTSNQAIAYAELQKARHESLIQDSIVLSTNLASMYPGLTTQHLAVEVFMVKLLLQFSDYLSGRIHIQTNPYYSYSTSQIVASGRRLHEHFRLLSPLFDTKRICIKIPSTWAGLQACRELEAGGIATLATTIFTIEQAQLAAQVGCQYIAPYVNELKVHFDSDFRDNNKSQKLCRQVQRMYESAGVKTRVMPASLTSIEEILELAGVHHITISPTLLQLLATKPAEGLAISNLFDPDEEDRVDMRTFGEEAEWRMAFTRSMGGNGEGERKLVQAINIFCDMQDMLEERFN